MRRLEAPARPATPPRQHAAAADGSGATADGTGAAAYGRGATADASSATAARRSARRAVLLGGAAALAGGATGVALGYRFRTEIRDVKLRTLAWPLEVPAEMDAFRREASRIDDARARQTTDDVTALKARYENPVFGKVRVWDLIERLALCVDPSDRRLFCGSQFVHAQQVFAAMQANGVDHPDMLLLGLMHDLGKVLLLANEAPENVVGTTRRIAGGEPGAGLDRAIYQFGHGEFLYSRIVGLVPEHVAWVVRWHNVDPDLQAPYMTERERAWTERWLAPFKRFDGGFVSPYYLPRLDLTLCRDLVERAFPSPVLV